MWWLLGVVGLRRGEILGLRWRDMDLERERLTVVRIRTEAADIVVEGPPKTAAGERTIALDADTLATLRRWRTRQKEERLRAGPLWHETNEDALATQTDGQRTKPNTLNHRLRGLC
jgi:integrase